MRIFMSGMMALIKHTLKIDNKILGGWRNSKYTGQIYGLRMLKI